MLTRFLCLVATVPILGFATPALAGQPHPPGPSPVSVSGDFWGGKVTTRVTAGGSRGAAKTESVASSSDSTGCVWMEAFVWERVPLPPEKAVHGTYWLQYCTNQGFKGLPQFVPDNAPNSPRAIVTPGLVAQRAVNHLQLPKPVGAHNPAGDATTNFAVWFWVPRSQWRVLSQTTRVRNVWARVTATPVKSVWDPGDGSAPVVCAGPGTPYDRSRSAEAQSTDCSHTYSRSSAGQPQTGPDPNDRFFVVRVSVTWRVTWVGAGGASGQLPDLVRVATFRLRVDDRETVVTGSSG